MYKAPSVPIVVDEPTARRMKFISLLAGNAGVIPQAAVDRLVTNEGREEIPGRLLRAFGEDVVEMPAATPPAPPPRPRIEVLRETPKPCARRTPDEQVAEWKVLYTQPGWEFTETGLVIPERRASAGFVRLLVVAKGLTNNRAYDWNDASFPCWRYNNDLNVAIPQSDRYPTDKPYAVWVRDGQEPDAEHRRKSANMAWQEGLKGETYMERSLHESKFFQETGKHLDPVGITIVTGSRCSDGFVPNCRWYSDKWYVNQYGIGYQSDSFGLREVSF